VPELVDRGGNRGALALADGGEQGRSAAEDGRGGGVNTETMGSGSINVVVQLRRTTPPCGMCWVPGGTFLMGSDAFYPEEAPAHIVAVTSFYMDTTAVTNAEYARFVNETGYLTVAERPLDPALYPCADPELAVPGALVFHKTMRPVHLNNFR